MWKCDCYDGYVLNFTISPASRASCILEFESVYPIKVKKEIKHETVEIVYNQTHIYQPEKIVEKWVENKTRIEELEKENEELKEKINSLRSELSQFQILNKTYHEAMSEAEKKISIMNFMLGTLSVALIILLSILLKLRK